MSVKMSSKLKQLGLWSCIYLGVASCAEIGAADRLENLHGPAFRIDLRLSKTKSVENVFLKKLGRKWVLQFRNIYGFSIYGPNKKVEAFGAEELASAVKLAMGRAYEFNGYGVDRIQIDLSLVKNLSVDLLDSLQSSFKNRTDLVQRKDPLAQKVVISELKQNEIVLGVCGALESLEFECENTSVSMNPIPISSEFIGRPWREVLDSPRFDLHPGLWFSIRVKPMPGRVSPT
jgi:hypothetical protein